MARNPVTGTVNADPNLNGTNRADEITGLAGDDDIDAGNNNDFVYGGDDDDDIEGQDGDDRLWGDAGNDSIYGGLGNGDHDIFYGGDGDDSLVLNDGDTGEMFGGTGTDRALIYALGSTGVELIMTGGNGAAMVGATQLLTLTSIEILSFSGSFEGDDHVEAANGSDSIAVYKGSNFVDAGGGIDDVHYTPGGMNELYGGGDSDRLYIETMADTTFEVTSTGIDDGFGSLIDHFEVYALFGGFGADTVSTWHGEDSLFGGNGVDRLTGRGGTDTLFGGNQDDRLYGGTGVDLLRGDDGIDQLFGGTDADTFQFESSAGLGDVINDWESIDSISIDSSVIADALAAGSIPAIADGGPSGTTGQFYTVYDAGTDRTWLKWDSNGTTGGGAMLICKLVGDVTLATGDVLIT